MNYPNHPIKAVRKSGSPFTTEYPSDGDTAATMAGVPERQKTPGRQPGRNDIGYNGNQPFEGDVKTMQIG